LRSAASAEKLLFVGGGAGDEDVVELPAVEFVGAGSADEDVALLEAEELVVAGPAEDDICPAAALRMSFPPSPLRYASRLMRGRR